jgi:DNA polymerase I
VSGSLFFDVETHSADLLYTLPPREFVRLIGYAWNAGPVTLTTDLDELLAAIRSADWIVGHNIHLFDLTAVFGKDSIEPLELARADRIFDTWTHSTLVNPAPKSYVDRSGRNIFVRGPEHAKSWHSLDNQALQLGVAGKSADLRALAREFGGFDLIPTMDTRFRDYLTADVIATRNVARKLLQLGPLDAYARREQLNAAIDAQNARNGWRVDQAAARARVAELDATRDRYMAMLVKEYNFPTTGAAPLRSNAGKTAITNALASVGISLDDLPRTKKAGKDTDRPSFGGQGLIDAAASKSPAAQELTAAIAAIGGLRPLAQSALDNTHPDGRVHPTINTLQRSGRKSTQKPGLTTVTARGSGKVEKSYFIPNQDDHVLISFDLSQADSRIVAAYSGDTEFALRFAPGTDAHLLTAWAIWGKDVVGTDKHNPTTAAYRDTSKACSHADAFRAGPGTIARTAGVPLEVATRFSDTMKRLYPKRLAWQDRVTKLARRGYVTNDWGRRMPVERDREFTQGPALYGQSGTREIIVDGLIRMLRKDIRIITFLVAQIHDELVFSVPEAEADYWADLIKSCMETTWQPSDGSGQPIHFPVGRSDFVKNWADCDH